jgi:hypothetical protein
MKTKTGGLWRIMCVAMTLAMGIAGRAPAATYYVDGNSPVAKDDNDGSAAAPWKTVQKAADAVGAGDVVIVRPGQYDEKVTVKQSGAKEKLLTLRGDPSRKARVQGFVLEGDFISIEGFEITSDANNAHGIFAGEAHYKTARTGCCMIDNFIHDIGGTAITSGEKALAKGNRMKNVGRGFFVNSGTLVEDNEVDTLVAPLVDKDGEMWPQKTQYAFFAGDDITFRGNYFHGCPVEKLYNWGVDFFVTWDAWILGPSHHILIERNRCFNATHGCEAEAVTLKQSSDITFRNNLFVNTVFVGVMPKDWSHITVENNTFINCGAYPVWLYSERQCEGSVIRNNLIAYWNRDPQVKLKWMPAESGIRRDPNLTIDCDYNMFWGCKNRGYGPHDFTAEPQFVDPEHDDFRLKPGSPGIDAGVSIPFVKTDLRGVARPQGKAYDIWAYELDPNQPPAAAPASAPATQGAK